jgi:hypothetical protein
MSKSASIKTTAATASKYSDGVGDGEYSDGVGDDERSSKRRLRRRVLGRKRCDGVCDGEC